MNMRVQIWLLAAGIIVFAGCATQRVDWSSRVGTYTFDQAVVELGPPDKQQKLTVGRNVAEWISRTGTGGVTTAVGTGFYNGGGGVSFLQTSPSFYESKLRLTFGTNHVLSAWSRN